MIFYRSNFALSQREIAFLESEIIQAIEEVQDGGAKHLIFNPDEQGFEAGATEQHQETGSSSKLTKDELLQLFGMLKNCVNTLEKTIEAVHIPERTESGATTVRVGSIRGQDGEERSNAGYREKIFPQGGEILDIFAQAGRYKVKDILFFIDGRRRYTINMKT